MTPVAYLLTFLLALALLLTGCSGGGKEDDTQSTSSASTQVETTECGDITFEVPLEDVDAIVESALEDGSEVSVEEVPVFDNEAGVIRQAKVTIIAGCGNTVVNEDNDSTSVSDDDTSTSVDLSGEQQ